MQQLQFLAGLVIISLLFGSLLLFFVWAVAKKQQRQKHEQEHLNIIAEIKSQKKEKVQYNDRFLDEFGFTLSTRKIYISNLSPTDTIELQHQQLIKQYIDTLIAKTRALALDLLPFYQQKKRLNSVIQQYTNTINNQYPNFIHAEIDGYFPLISDYKAVSLFRIVQEIVANTLYHATATFLYLELRKRDHSIFLKTKDNGSGFDFDKALELESSLGLYSIKTRVQLLNGTIDVCSEKGGTMYIIEVPL